MVIKLCCECDYFQKVFFSSLSGNILTFKIKQLSHIVKYNLNPSTKVRFYSFLHWNSKNDDNNVASTDSVQYKNNQLMVLILPYHISLLFQLYIITCLLQIQAFVVFNFMVTV